MTRSTKEPAPVQPEQHRSSAVVVQARRPDVEAQAVFAMLARLSLEKELSEFAT